MVGAQECCPDFPYFVGKLVVIEHIFEYNGNIQLGDSTVGERTEHSRLDVILDKLNEVYTELVDSMEAGGLDQLSAAEKISWWQESHWCDRHHILDWTLGGRTDLDNLTLLCRHQHTHFLQKGWTCRINADGLPEWIPPRWLDTEQRPQLNARIRKLETQRQLGRRRQLPAAT